MSDFKLDKPISAEGKNCRLCGNPIDTKTTTCMLCKKCRGREAMRHYKEKTGLNNPMDDPKCIAKIKQTMQDRYGANCAMNVPEFREKFEATCRQRYGTSYYVNTEAFVNKSSAKSIVNSKFNELMLANGIVAEAEKEYDDKRFDFRLQDKKIFIEVDPTYTHNVAGNHWDTDGSPRNQQLIKTLIAEKYDYRCIHVFDWDNWDDIIDLLRDTKKIYARKCTIKMVQDKSYDEFINENHLQRNCKGTKIAIGLYYNDEMVQVMTFGKPRYNKNYEWELLRLCTKKGLTVVGGASKLFKYATNELGLTNIISYCDRSKFTGAVYRAMGMSFVRATQPQEVWSKGRERITSSLLRQRGFDQLFDANFGKGTSNEQLMLEHGWLPVYDCGQLVFAYGSNSDSTNEPDVSKHNYAELLKSIEKSKEKICAFCNKPFVPVSNFQKYCKRPHYMTCPVCGKDYLVLNNENLKRPPVACSYACRAEKSRQTSLKKYGTSAPGNNKEARAKAAQTLKERYNVESSSMQSEEVRQKAKETLLSKYGVDNIQKLPEVARKSADTRASNWISKVHELLPVKINQVNIPRKFKIDDDKMTVYSLTQRSSSEFLTKYGFQLNPTFGKIQMSLGLVNDGIIYQVIRFERRHGKIVLSNFGTRENYYNPNEYSKLAKAAIEISYIDAFTAEIPRGTPQSIIDSLSLTKVADGEYTVYWRIDGKLTQLTQRDDIDDMLSKYDYETTDYLDKYQFEDRGQFKDLAAIDQLIIEGGRLQY